MCKAEVLCKSLHVSHNPKQILQCDEVKQITQILSYGLTIDRLKSSSYLYIVTKRLTTFHLIYVIHSCNYHEANVIVPSRKENDKFERIKWELLPSHNNYGMCDMMPNTIRFI